MYIHDEANWINFLQCHIPLDMISIVVTCPTRGLLRVGEPSQSRLESKVESLF